MHALLSMPSAGGPAASIRRLLDETAAGLAAGQLDATFIEELRSIRESAGHEWAKVVATCREHPVCKLLREDPLTSRSAERPRGYPGDAELLDLIYSRDARRLSGARPTALGELVFNAFVNRPAPTAVRLRRRYLSSLIDESCLENPRARVLSVACGHLREAEDSEAVRARKFERFVGLDQDSLTIACLRDEKERLGIEPLLGSIATILRGRLAGNFSLIYSAGLYDYLDQPLAARLTARLFGQLEPGGRLVIANFLPDLVDCGYMEAFMDWWLIYRDRDAIGDLAREVPVDRVGSCRVLRNENATVGYLDIRKAAD